MITTHVLDQTRGHPAAGLQVTLERRDASGWTALEQTRTGTDGRAAFAAAGTLGAGEYRLRFDTGAYFRASGTATLYPEICIAVALAAPVQDHHLPLLLSPFAYTTYRGS